MLFSHGAVASPKLFGMATVPGGGAAAPVAIDPTTGTETPLIPGTTYFGSAFDAAASGNTVYFVSSSFRTSI
jgi:hypothetical protein